MENKTEKKKFYFEHTIKLNEPQKSYFNLLEMFFKPEEFFNSNRFEEPLFDKIFPEKPDYQANHAERIEKTYKKHLPQEIADLYATDEFGKSPETQKAVFDYFFQS